jgi:DNA replication protein DnaC
MAAKYNSEQIEKYMRQLRLGALAKDWAKIPFTNKEQYVTDLLELELREREVNRINRGIKSAGFNVIKHLDDFVWTNSVALPDGITQSEIESFSFVGKKENLILMGAVGTGKTHLATGVALSACHAGKSVRFFTAANLANILLEKNHKGQLNNLLTSFRKVDLMVIDEVGFVPFHKDAAELLFQVISDCYERRSLIITSNLEFSQWNTIFGDDRLTAALIDRLIHHSHILIFSGQSFRLKQSMSRQKINN